MVDRYQTYPSTSIHHHQYAIGIETFHAFLLSAWRDVDLFKRFPAKPVLCGGIHFVPQPILLGYIMPTKSSGFELIVRRAH
jgi:hypothetical protein